MKDFSNFVFSRRKALGLTQEELANRLSVSPNYIYLLESGKKPMTEQMKEKLEKISPNSPPLTLSELPPVAEISKEFLALMDKAPFRISQPERISQNLFRAWIGAESSRKRNQLETLSGLIADSIVGGDPDWSAEQAKAILEKLKGKGE